MDADKVVAVPPLLSLPEASRTVFARPPLALAVCQLQFTPTLSIADFAVAGSFQRAISPDYLLSTPAQQLHVRLGVGPGDVQVQQGSSSRQWAFSDASETWSVVLSPEFLTLETRAYESFDDFLARLRRLLEVLMDQVQPAAGTRIGLRYINEIRGSSLPWNKIIRADLLGVVASGPLSGDVEHSVQEVVLRFREHEGQGINIRHGLFPGGTTVRPLMGSDVTVQPFYLLDFDVFREYPRPAMFAMDPESICQQVQRFHEEIHRLFHWSVTEDYLSTLGVADACHAVGPTP